VEEPIYIAVFLLESVSEAEIGLDKVVVSFPIGMINEVITNFAEQPNMRSKAIFQPAADVPERATLDVLRDVVEPLIELREASVYRRPTPRLRKDNRTHRNRRAPSEHPTRNHPAGPAV
jgi:hypothetical protein